jgi:hypothetical protein
MRRLSASLLFLTAAFAFGQTPAQNPPAVTAPSGQMLVAPTVHLTSVGCPVGFYASRRAITELSSVGDARLAAPGQGLHLTLFAKPAIESIEVTVYGTSPNPVILPTSNFASSSDTDTISKTFSIERKPDTPRLKEADVWMEKVGSVRWADLIAVTFADGTSWRATGDVKCRAVPSNFLLVNHR